MPFSTDPALVFEREIDGGTTHLLAIGIGAYPHLQGGADTLAQYHLSLGQLSSPPVSALQVAQWFAANYVCNDKPLASIGLILSSGSAQTLQWTGAAGAITPPAGTLADVKAAVKAWIKRANDPADRLILYFCGHGVAVGAQSFCLLRDFGADDDSPMENAINYQEFAAALETRTASEQLLIFDCCRTGDRLVTANQTGGNSLIDVLPNGRQGLDDPVRQCAVFAASRDQTAAGLKNRPSLCAQALLRGLSGAASTTENGAHHVTTSRLVEALDIFQTHGPDALKVAEPSRPDITRYAMMSVRHLPAPPAIPVFIRRQTRARFEGARITAQRRGTITELAAAYVGEELEAPLPLGEYDINVWIDDQPCPTAEAFVAPVRQVVDVGDPP